ncbi:MAG TPA: hypothetical protein VNT99_06890 [Methylomirabilota bacterium]|nr:hypothetical protein [Methylomirabilota bacterium]
MKHGFVKLGTMVFIFGTASLLAQDAERNLNPVYPQSALVVTNKTGIGAPRAPRGVIISGTTNLPSLTNGVGQGAPGLNNGIDSGERKSEPTGPGKAPSVGPAPSAGNAPSVGKAPSVGGAPSSGPAPRIDGK